MPGYARQHGCDRKALPASAAAGYGALSGVVLWLSIYQLDLVKSKLQTDALPSQAASRKYSGAIDCARKVWAAESAAGFVKGLTPTMIRCVGDRSVNADRVVRRSRMPACSLVRRGCPGRAHGAAYELARKQLG